MIDRVGQRDYHIFRYSKANIQEVFPEEIFQEVISTAAFKRLASIHFLGSIDNLFHSSQRGIEERRNRYDHSLAVASLAKRFMLAKGVGGKEYETAIVAALLHDIGHAPLSHSLEPSFKSFFEIDHHLVGEKILKGEVRIGRRLSRVFERHQINNFEVMALVSGFGDGAAKELFCRPINVDTIEGIIRSASYRLRSDVVINPVVVLDAFADLGPQSQDVLDEFWLLKDFVYQSVIQSPKGLIADYLCKRYMELHVRSFDPSYYYGTEKELKTDHRNLFETLEEFGRSNKIPPSLIRDGEDLSYVKRRFFVDKTVPLRSYSDVSRRYLQSKKKVELTIRKRGGDDAHGMQSYAERKRLF